MDLELHTGDAPRAGAFDAELLQWRAERVASDLTLDVGARVGGGSLCPGGAPAWLADVAVADVGATTERARELGATALSRRAAAAA